LKSLASAIVLILKWNPQILRSAHPFFCVLCDFMMGLDKPQLRAKFEVASPSCYINIIGELPKYCAAPLAQGHPHLSCWYYLMMGLSKPKLCTKFEIASFSRCKILKGKPLISGISPSPGPHPLFLLVRFDDGTWQTAAACQIWLHVLRKYKGICF